MRDYIQQRMVGHIYERVAGLTFAGIGIAAINTPFDISPFLRVLFSSDVATAIFTLTGIVRLCVSMWTPHLMVLRILIAIASCGLWAQWVFVLANAAAVSGVLRPGIFHVSAMIYGEFALIHWLSRVRRES